MPRYFAALWRWLREQSAPAPPPVPPRRSPSVSDATPPPTTVIVYPPRYTHACPFCGTALTAEGRHECRADSWLD